MKKKLSLVFALVLVTAIMLSACSGGFNSGGFKKVNFDGAVSAESYSDAETAVKAFLADELEGESASLELVKYEKTADLSAKEIEALSLGDINASEVKSAEKVTVSYSETLHSSQAVYSAASDATKKYEIYLLTMEDDEVRYFVPQARTGDAVTKSEYNALFDMETWENYTCEISSTGTSITSGAGIPATTTKTTTKGIMKVTKNEAYEEISTSASNMTMVIKVYVIIENNTVKGYTCIDAPYMPSGWQEVSFDSETVDDILSSYTDTGDMPPYDILERTNSGYKISMDKYFDWIKETMSDELYMYDDISGDLYCTVSNGRLQKCVGNVSANVSMSGLTVSMLQKEEMVYKNYGTTTITLPDDLKEFLANN